MRDRIDKVDNIRSAISFVRQVRRHVQWNKSLSIEDWRLAVKQLDVVEKSLLDKKFEKLSGSSRLI